MGFKTVATTDECRPQAGSMKLTIELLVVLTNCALIWAMKTASSSASTRQNYNQGLRLISFDTVDKDIAIGLDYLLPFIKVPVKRKRNEAPKPLVIVNSAAILSCGLVAAGGLVAGHLIRSMGLETIVSEGKTEKPEEHRRSLAHEEPSFLQIFDNFKLFYRNESGERVETGLSSLVDTIEHGFLDKDIDLPACLLKSLCTLTYKAARNVRSGQATDLELMLDGASNWSWLLSWLEQSALREALEAGRLAAPHYCNTKYPRCKWTAPDEEILNLVHNNVQFN